MAKAKEEPQFEEGAGYPSPPEVETVVMEHPDLENSRTTSTRAAYDEVWAEKGWVVVEATEEVPPSSAQGEGSEAAS